VVLEEEIPQEEPKKKPERKPRGGPKVKNLEKGFGANESLNP